VTDRKNGRILFDRPKPTVGCSASGRRKRSVGGMWLLQRDENVFRILVMKCDGN
jgi:hypothetical protein